MSATTRPQIRVAGKHCNIRPSVLLRGAFVKFVYWIVIFISRWHTHPVLCKFEGTGHLRSLAQARDRFLMLGGAASLDEIQ